VIAVLVVQFVEGSCKSFCFDTSCAANPKDVPTVKSNVVCRFVLLVIIAVSGCSKHVTSIPSPPEPATRGSNKDMGGLHFEFYKWKEGLAIMFVDRINGSVVGKGSSDDTTVTDRVSVRRADGVGYEWRLKTKDGRSADLTINDVSYDLTKGTLFAIQLDGENVIVHQVDRDLSKLDIDLRTLTAFVNNSPEIIQLVTGEGNKE